MSQPSALPNFYYFTFRYYEALLGVLTLVTALADPKGTYDQQGNWPNNVIPAESLTLAAKVTLIQYAHVCFLIGLLNWFVLGAARKHLSAFPRLQEKILVPYMGVLLAGDFLHIGLTLYAWGEDRWNTSTWTRVVWGVIVVGSSLLIPRACWVLGFGRYVHTRDAQESEVKRR